jgi:molybdenum cofactor guanylyltransferase
MGRDKATIEIDGIPLIRRIYDVVAGCQDRDPSLTDRIYIVTPWQQRYEAILPATCHFIPELQPDLGPLTAFTQGLTAITSPWVLLLACDLPNLSTSVVRAWIDGLPFVAPASIAYLPRHDRKGWEPLCGFYRQICHQSLREYIHSSGKSFQGWLAMNAVTELVIGDPASLANCNTPAELAAILADRLD